MNNTPHMAPEGGSGAMLSSLLGFHLNPLLALCIVVGLMLLTPFILRRLKQKLPHLFKDAGATQRLLRLAEVLPLDSKRRLLRVEVSSIEGVRELLLLTGGSQDVVVSFQELQKEQQRAVESKPHLTQETSHEI